MTELSTGLYDIDLYWHVIRLRNRRSSNNQEEEDEEEEELLLYVSKFDVLRYSNCVD